MTSYVLPIDIRFSDLDALGHLNSTKSFVYAEHARVTWLLREGFASGAHALPIIVASAKAEYHAPLRLGTPIEVAMSTTRIGTKSWDWTYLVRGAAGGPTYSTVTTTQVAYDYAASKSRRSRPRSCRPSSLSRPPCERSGPPQQGLSPPRSLGAA